MAANPKERMRRLLIAEQVLTRKFTMRQAAPELQRLLGISEKFAYRLLEEVTEMWKLESESVTREERRNAVRAYVQTIADLAINARRAIATPAGLPVLDKSGNVVTEPAPKYTEALRAAECLTRLDGLAAESENTTAADGLAGLLASLREGGDIPAGPPAAATTTKH